MRFDGDNVLPTRAHSAPFRSAKPCPRGVRLLSKKPNRTEQKQKQNVVNNLRSSPGPAEKPGILCRVNNIPWNRLWHRIFPVLNRPHCSFDHRVFTSLSCFGRDPAEKRAQHKNHPGAPLSTRARPTTIIFHPPENVYAKVFPRIR